MHVLHEGEDISTVQSTMTEVTRTIEHVTGTGDLQPGLTNNGTKGAIWHKVTEETLLLGSQPTAEKFVAGLIVCRPCLVPKL